MDYLFKYVLVLADDALILAQRLSEWAFKAPFFLTSVVQVDHILILIGPFGLNSSNMAKRTDDRSLPSIRRSASMSSANSDK